MIKDISLDDRIKERYCKSFERFFYDIDDTNCCSRKPTFEQWIENNETRFLVRRYAAVKEPLTKESYPSLLRTYMFLCNQLGRIPK